MKRLTEILLVQNPCKICFEMSFKNVPFKEIYQEEYLLNIRSELFLLQSKTCMSFLIGHI